VERSPPVLILVPSHVLELQLLKTISSLSSNITAIPLPPPPGVRSYTDYIRTVSSTLNNDSFPFIGVGTPKSLISWWKAGKKGVHGYNRMKEALNGARHVVLDEADSLLLNGGHKGKQEITEIVQAFREIGSQIIYVGATVRGSAVDSLLGRKTIILKGCVEGKPPRQISEEFINISSLDDSPSKLNDLIQGQISQGYFKILIFANSIMSALKISRILETSHIKDLNISLIHSEIDADHRVDIINKFGKGFKESETNQIHVLISTDIVARGVDFQNVDVVINAEFPQSHAQYLHRAGRTGRGGKPGKGIT